VSPSLGRGEAHPVVVPVEHGVVRADEHVSQDPQRPGGGGDVQAHEAAQADGLSSLTHLERERRQTQRNALQEVNKHKHV